MKEIFDEILNRFKALKFVQKCVFAAVACSIGTTCYFLSFKSHASHSLDPSNNLNSLQREKVKTFLTKEHIAFEEKNGELFVSEKQTGLARKKIEELGFGGKKSSKGFEIFDSNTWIKGEKELQILEMRALKGQLENDIMRFEKIKSASVILDIPPTRPLGHVQYSPKASVIVSLESGTFLSSSDIHAITCHLAAAIRGLEPAMVSIADTSGKFYQNHSFTPPSGEELKSQINDLLIKLFGSGRAHVFMNENQEIHIALDAAFNKEGTCATLCRLINHLCPEKERPLNITVDFIAFSSPEKPLPSNFPLTSFLLTLGGLILVTVLMLIYWKTSSNGFQEEKGTSTKIDIDRLVDAIKNEESSTLALFLSYLEPKKAEKILLKLPKSIQEEIQLHLISKEC